MTGTLLLEMTLSIVIRSLYFVIPSVVDGSPTLLEISQNNSNNKTKYLTKKSAENVMFSAVIFCVKCKRL